MATIQQAFLESVNPTTEQVMARFPTFSAEQVERALVQTHWAFRAWREASFAERAELCRRAAAHLRGERERLARLITLEMGKPIVEAEAEIDKCAWGCEFYAEHAAGFLADQPHPSTASESYVTFEPLGTILAIMPWNFPFWQAFRFAAPALMAGNTALLKHSSNVPQCALAIEEVFRASGFPRGIFRTLLLTAGAAEALVADPRIAGVSMTGSDAAGSRVGAAAGRAIKKSVLELGGSDPFLVLPDADLDQAVETATRSRYRNAGQSCIAAKRFIVVDAVADAFAERLVAAAARLRVGDPLDRATEVGPLARADLRATLERQVRESAAMGARVLLGGGRPPRPGYFFLPTVLDHVAPDMPAFREETFGPLAAIVRVRDVDEAIRVANDSPYGLSAALWTADIEQAKVWQRRLEVGNVFINGMSASDPRLPFGGVKRSGYGRELSEFGIREFTNVKTVWIGPMREEQPPRLHSE